MANKQPARHLQIKKRANTVKRLKSRNVNIIQQREQDVQLIDIALYKLFNGGDKIALNLKKDILEPNNVQMHPTQMERFWELLISSGLVAPVIGFGNVDKLNITQNGYKLVQQYGNYSGYLQAMQLQQQLKSQQVLQLPQIIIQNEEEEHDNPNLTELKK